MTLSTWFHILYTLNEKLYFHSAEGYNEDVWNNRISASELGLTCKSVKVDVTNLVIDNDCYIILNLV